MMRFRLILFFAASLGMAQPPVVTNGGVVSAASWSSPVSPGQIAAIFGTNLASGTATAVAPYPNTLNGTSVAINGVPAPVLFVSPTQVNIQVPSSLVISGADVVTGHVVVSTPAGSSATTALSLTRTYPGLFTADASGCGQAAALNVLPGAVGINSPSNSAAPGDYIALFGTGFGLSAAQPQDGTAADGAVNLNVAPTLSVDGNPVTPTYAGLAPELVGVDQINFQVPATTRNGCAVPVSASSLFGSNSVTLSVQNGRGMCTDPPIQSYGQIALYKSFFSGTPTGPSASDGFTATFPAGPGLQTATPDKIVYAPDYVANVFLPTAIVISTDGATISNHYCTVRGYTHLSAGTIHIQGSSSADFTPQPLLTGGVSYGGPLPDGFIAAGNYSITGDGGDVQLHAAFTVGPPIQLETTFPPGTKISESQPLTVKWNGGDATELVKLTLISPQGRTQIGDYTYAPASAGSITITPFCTGGPRPSICTMGLSPSDNAQIVVDVIPAPDRVTTVQLPGVTGPVQLTYQYGYVFTGLTLSN